MSGGSPVFPEFQQRTSDPGTAGFTASDFYDYQAYTGSPSGTYGAWSQLIASTPFDADGIIVWLPPSAAGSEHIIIKNLIIAAQNGTTYWLYAPIQVPAGSRIAFQAAE
jgi:hypothetical protein